MQKGKTKSGFSYKVADGIETDWRLLDITASLRNRDDFGGQIQAYKQLIALMMGEDAEERLCNHVKTKEGVIPAERIIEEVSEILEAIQKEPEVKKSSPLPE